MWLSALVLGFAGSFHCVGMCGPLAMQINPKGSIRLLMHRLFYHAGRIAMYAMLGFAAGTAGWFVQLHGWQGRLSIISGIVLLITVLSTHLQRLFVPHLAHAVASVKRRLSYFIHQRSLPAAIITGVLNGLLPCGLVYTAMAISLVQPSLKEGILMMLLFGLGTLPALIAISYISTGVFKIIPFSKVQNALVLVVSITMIWRGISIEMDPSLAIPVCH